MTENRPHPSSTGTPPAADDGRILPFQRTAPDAAGDASLTDAAVEQPDSKSTTRWRLGPLALERAGGWQPPVSGALAVIFGVASLFKAAPVLAPVAILLAFVAGFRGHHSWAVIGLGSALAGLLTSTWFWALLGLAWLYQSWG